MNIEFEYKPFDRVTVNLYGEDLRAVLSDRCGKHLSGAYADSSGLNGFTCDAHRVRPGHYDADGNWLPQPGEPCHVILANGSPKNMVVVSADAHRVAAIGEYDGEKTVYFKRDLGFVDTDFDFGLVQNSAALLRPGRIKTAQQ